MWKPFTTTPIGATAATYGDVALLPLGTTYTHMYVKISRKFIIKTDDDNDLETDNGDVCRSRASTDSMYDSDEATDKYTHVPTRAEGTSGGAAAEQNAYLMNAGTNGVKFCTNASCGGTANQTFGYTCAHCTAQKTDLDSNDDYHEVQCQISEIYNVKKNLEKIIVNFISTEIEWVSLNSVDVNEDNKDSVVDFLETLEEDDDVQNVYSNVNLGGI